MKDRIVTMTCWLVVIFSQGSYCQSFTNPLFIPDTISGSNFNLTIDNGVWQFFNGVNTNTMGYNGNVLGPTLFMNRFDSVQINVTNNLPDTTTTHWHGFHIPAIHDGGPHSPIAPGATWSPHFAILDKAATFWYHPHLHFTTNLHVSLGASGVIIVRDAEEASRALPRTYGVDDFPLIIQSKAFAPNGQIALGGLDSTMMVNATVRPRLVVPAQPIRLRMLGGASSRVFMIGMSDNRIFHQIATDGSLLPMPVALNRVRLANGERAEVVIDFSGQQGNTFFLMSYASELGLGIPGAGPPGPNPFDGTDFQLLRFDVAPPNGSAAAFSATDTLTTITPLLEADANVTRNLEFTRVGAGPFLIDNQPFSHHVINQTILLDNTEVWVLENRTISAHPFHIHMLQFQLLDKGGLPPPLNEQGWKDVVLVDPGQTVRFIAHFEDFGDTTTPYMYHCHNLVHEDGGMMGQFIVTDNCCDVVPEVSTSNVAGSNATLNWSGCPGNVQYHIRGRALGATNFVNLIVPSGGTSSKDVIVTAGQSYEWQVRAINLAVNDTCTWSALDTFRAICRTPDSSWTDPVVSTGARLNWNTVEGATGYRIRGQAVGSTGNTFITVNGGNTSSKDVFGLTSGVTYQWQVRALCGSGGNSGYTDVDTFTTSNANRIWSHQHNPTFIYPNPFKSETTIELQVANDEERVTVEIYDLVGKRVAQLANDETFTSGIHKLTFNSAAHAGNFFICRVKIGSQEFTEKIVKME